MRRPHGPPSGPPHPAQFQTFSYGPLEFNINRAQLLAANTRKYRPQTRQPSQEMVGSNIDIDPGYIEKSDLRKPVLFATLGLTGHPPELLIDGNHRVLKAIRHGQPIRAIVLDLEDTLKIVRGPVDLIEQMKRHLAAGPAPE